MNVDFKQCPDCGAANPAANSFCSRCRRDMTSVPIPMTESLDDIELPDPGYQPTLASDEFEFMFSLTAFISVIHISGMVMDPRVPVDLARRVDVLRDKITAILLKNKFQRTPTADEIAAITSTVVPSKLSEGLKRYQRVMDATALTDMPQVDKLAELRAEMDAMALELVALTEKLYGYGKTEES